VEKLFEKRHMSKKKKTYFTMPSICIIIFLHGYGQYKLQGNIINVPTNVERQIYLPRLLNEEQQ
jgi:hypothetical protein